MTPPNRGIAVLAFAALAAAACVAPEPTADASADAGVPGDPFAGPATTELAAYPRVARLNLELAAELDGNASEAELEPLLRQRADALIEQARTAPRALAELALPAEVAARLPAGLLYLVERPVAIDGFAEVRIEETADPTAPRITSWLHPSPELGADHPAALHLADPDPRLESGSRVSGRGVVLGDHAIVTEPADALRTTDDSDDEPRVRLVSGPVAVGVVLVRFADQDLACSGEQLEEILFEREDSVAEYYRAVSAGQVQLRGAVVGEVTITEQPDDGGCASSTWSRRAVNALGGDGVFTGYDIRMFVMLHPGCNPTANFGGWEPGGFEPRVWMYGCVARQDSYAHELGHTFDMSHAAEQQGDDEREYGDSSCVMGYSGLDLRCVNAAHALQSGWLASSEWATAEDSGNYQLAPLAAEAPAPAVRALRIPRPTPDNGADSLYLSYRVASGCDATLNERFHDTVQIHRWSGQFRSRTVLVASLAPGDRFVHDDGLTIDNLSTAGDPAATVRVRIPGSSAGPTDEGARPAPHPDAGPAGGADSAGGDPAADPGSQIIGSGCAVTGAAGAAPSPAPWLLALLAAVRRRARPSRHPGQK
jgi:hypothetical protein